MQAQAHCYAKVVCKIDDRKFGNEFAALKFGPAQGKTTNGTVMAPYEQVLGKDMPKEHSEPSESDGQQRIAALRHRLTCGFDEVARLAALSTLREGGALVLIQPGGNTLIGQHNVTMPEAVRLIPADYLYMGLQDIFDVSQRAPWHPYTNGERFRLRAMTSVPVNLGDDPVGVLLSFSSRKIGPITGQQLQRFAKVKEFAEHLLTYRVQMDEARSDYPTDRWSTD